MYSKGRAVYVRIEGILVINRFVMKRSMGRPREPDMEEGGLFVYSDASNGISGLIGYTIADPADGNCTVVVTQIGGEPIAAAGKVAKGTFFAIIRTEGPPIR